MTDARQSHDRAVEWNSANIVTVIRICFIPIFLILYLAPWTHLFWNGDTASNIQYLVSMIVFILIALTDSVDGYLARSRNMITVFGKFIDPIADKMLVIAALIALVQHTLVPAWIPIIIVARELLVSGLRMLAASRGVVLAANWIGKVKTFTTMVAICLFILCEVPLIGRAYDVIFYIGWALMIVAVILTIISMIDYFVHAWHLLAHDTTEVSEPDAGAVAMSDDTTPPVPLFAREGSHELARIVLEAAQKRNVTIGTAESCTGGLIAGALTSVPGSSETVAGAIVSYMPRIKESELGVPDATIAAYGVVSAEVAGSMAEGARRVLDVDYAVSTTGVAGPSGGTEDVPVGTVWFAVASPEAITCHHEIFSGDRTEVRAQAVDKALELLADALDARD